MSELLHVADILLDILKYTLYQQGNSSILKTYPFTPVTYFLRKLLNGAMCSINVALFTLDKTHAVLWILFHLYVRKLWWRKYFDLHVWSLVRMDQMFLEVHQRQKRRKKFKTSPMMANPKLVQPLPNSILHTKNKAMARYNCHLIKNLKRKEEHRFQEKNRNPRL